MIVDDMRVVAYVCGKTGIEVCPPYTALGIETDGRIVAGTVFSQFERHDVHVTVAGERKAFTRSYLKAVGDYVFNRLGCIRMTIVSEQPNVIDIATRLGAKPEGLIRNHFGVGRDGILLGILKDEWPFNYENLTSSATGQS